jgi:hypothetical protein
MGSSIMVMLNHSVRQTDIVHTAPCGPRPVVWYMFHVGDAIGNHLTQR